MEFEDMEFETLTNLVSGQPFGEHRTELRVCRIQCGQTLQRVRIRLGR